MFLVVAIGWTAFALYGSLVPLRFSAVSLGEAVERFQALMATAPQGGSRTDWATNFLLLLPSAFFGLGAMWSRRSFGRNVLASAAVMAVLAVVACLLEFLQLWVPGRTSSRRDVEAQWLGASVGILLWWAAGRFAIEWIARVRAATRPLSGIELALVFYTVLVVGYGILPLDLTISPIQILAKAREGRVILVPFLFTERTWELTLYSQLSEIALWIPVGAYWMLRRAGSIQGAVLRTLAVAAVLETIQIFVVTRTVDVNDLIAAAAGGALGAWGVRRLWLSTTAPVDRPTARIARAWLVWALAVAAWCVVAATAYWYPFDFHLTGAFIHDRLARVSLVPFHSYYWSTEFNATTQLFRKMAVFVPLGMILGRGWQQLGHGSVARLAYATAAAGFVVCAAVAIELGQVALPGKVPDPTDAALGVLGSIVGVMLVRWIGQLRHGAEPVATPAAMAADATPARHDAPDRLVTPWLGVSLYVWLLALAALDSQMHGRIRTSGLLDGVGVAIAVWTVVDAALDRRRRIWIRHTVPLLCAVLLGWLILSTVAAGLRGDWTAECAYRFRQFLMAATIFAAAATGYAHRWHAAILAIPVALIVGVEIVTEFSALALDQNLAAFAVLALPALALAGWLASPAMGWLVIAPLVMLLAVGAAATRNRGGGLGLVAVAFMLAIQSRRRVVLLSLLAGALLTVVASLGGTGFFSRFEDIWTRGPAYETVQQRFDLWTDSWRLGVAHPIVGVGLGNYGRALGGTRDPHNYAAAMLSETGFPGAVLYIAFFAAALATALRAGRGADHPGTVGRAAAAGLVGFLVVGFFLGMQTNALAFAYAGLAVNAAVARRYSTEP